MITSFRTGVARADKYKKRSEHVGIVRRNGVVRVAGLDVQLYTRNSLTTAATMGSPCRH
ncbi:hypothetical protein PSCICM_18680 [Pseudomonas cichorii]|uniref:Uncharacterized protein n=1 Tax=Pseudomonas cichorii TaxID=36746 RepID=A0ABQ1DNN6_PSECI|nr:hypothetical protein PSCICM_18680 [Pseudomonas cichorii]GFM92559.1 hypothetical protein PSCICP_25310 [Pseudomonas cichorii]